MVQAALAERSKLMVAILNRFPNWYLAPRRGSGFGHRGEKFPTRSHLGHASSFRDRKVGTYADLVLSTSHKPGHIWEEGLLTKKMTP